jgi:hypothetical protein
MRSPAGESMLRPTLDRRIETGGPRLRAEGVPSDPDGGRARDCNETIISFITTREPCNRRLMGFSSR